MEAEPGGAASFWAADVASETDIAAFVAGSRERHGLPTVLVNNAGVNANFDAVEMTGEEWDRFFGIDLKAAWLGAAHVRCRTMLEAGRGLIVNVSPLNGFVTLEGFFPYAVRRSPGCSGRTRSLALDYGPRGIRVNRVAPGFIRHPAGPGEHRSREGHRGRRACDAAGVAPGASAILEEVAQVVRFLASAESSYVTGASLLVDEDHRSAGRDHEPSAPRNEWES